MVIASFDQKLVLIKKFECIIHPSTFQEKKGEKSE
jgi:hypothetical protein